LRGFRSDDQRRAMFASMSNRFSVYPPENVLSTPPQYVYTGGYDNSMDKHFSGVSQSEAEERAELYKKLAVNYRKAEAKTKDMGLKAKLDIEGKILEKKAADLEQGGFYPDQEAGADEKKDIEVLKRGGMVYVSPPDSEEEFRKYDEGQRRKFDKKQFAEAPKKESKQTDLCGGAVQEEVVEKEKPKVETSKQSVFGVPFGSEELVADVQEPLKEKEITAKAKQINFGEEYKRGRRFK